MTRPIGYFVHHQGRGHAARAVALANALPRPVTIFTARPEALPRRAAHVDAVALPSLFERPPGQPDPPGLAAAPTPPTLHCAPLGWPGIRTAAASLCTWFAQADPALFVTDVSAELAQLARIASVPTVPVLQHGDRGDPGHAAAYAGAAGLLAPWHAALGTPRLPTPCAAPVHFAPGLGLDPRPHMVGDRAALGALPDRRLCLVISGAGGDGIPIAPLCMAARACPDTQFVVLGHARTEWHATRPGNLTLAGWCEDVRPWLDAADIVIAACGNTLVHEILARGTPFVARPEWRYFGEQTHKARALHAAGAAIWARDWPDTPRGWTALLRRAARIDPDRQRALVDPRATERAAAWLDALARDLWALPRMSGAREAR